MFLFLHGNNIVIVPFKIQKLYVHICTFVSSGVLLCGLLYHYLAIFNIHTLAVQYFLLLVVFGFQLKSAVNV